VVIILCLYIVALWIVFSKFKAGALEMAVGNDFDTYRRIHSCDVSRAV